MVRYLRRHRLFFYVCNRQNLLIVRLLLTISFLCFLTVAVDAHFRPIASQMAEAKAQNIAEKTVNDAIAESISKNADEYKNILTFEKNEAGQITALRTNMVSINSIKTEVTKKLIESLSLIDQSSLGIPMGNLVNWSLLSGRGPSIPVRILPVGSAETNFISVFTSAGINQTKHQIVMESRVWVNVIMPGYSVKKEITSEVNVAETILVGSVPNSYTYIGGSGSSGSNQNNQSQSQNNNSDLLPKMNYRAN